MAKGLGAIMAEVTIAFQSDSEEERANMLLAQTPWGSDCPLCQRPMGWNGVVFVCRCLKESYGFNDPRLELANNGRFATICTAAIEAGFTPSPYSYHCENAAIFVVIVDEEGREIASLVTSKGGVVWSIRLDDDTAEVTAQIWLPDWWPEDLHWDESLPEQREQAKAKAKAQAKAEAEAQIREEEAQRKKAQATFEAELAEKGFFDGRCGDRQLPVGYIIIRTASMGSKTDPYLLAAAPQMTVEQFRALVKARGDYSEVQSVDQQRRQIIVASPNPGQWIGRRGATAKALSKALGYFIKVVEK